MKNVDLTNPGKLIVLCLVIIGSFTFIIASLFVNSGPDTTPAWALLSGAGMYLIGNGTGARKGVPTIAPFTPTVEKAIQHLEEVKEKQAAHDD